MNEEDILELLHNFMVLLIGWKIKETFRLASTHRKNRLCKLFM